MVDIPQTGDVVKLFQSLLNATWQGIVCDADTPALMSATLEAIGMDAVITVPVLVGPRGAPGQNALLVDLQWPAPASPSGLPNNWGPSDKNKGFWINGLIYVWDGATWRTGLPGPAGPPGPTPVITPEVEVIPMDQRPPGTTSRVIPTGTTLEPHWKFELLSPPGPKGDNAAINQASDMEQVPPLDGQTIVWSEALDKWRPSDLTTRRSRMYSIPEEAFQNFNGLAQRATILSYVIEEQDYDWVPWVTGHFKAFGVELDSDPLIIGSEVRIGSDPMAGTLVGRGFGNIASWSHITPHFSSSGDTTAAVAPGNGRAVIPAGQTAQINVNLVNDGLLGAYIFNKSGAQLSVLTIEA